MGPIKEGPLNLACIILSVSLNTAFLNRVLAGPVFLSSCLLLNLSSVES